MKNKKNPFLYALVAAGVTDNTLWDDIAPFFGQDPKSFSRAESFGQIIVSAVDILLLVVGSISVIYIMVGGYRYVMAHGSEEGTEAAKKTLSGAVLGLIVTILAFTIVKIISTVLIKGAPGVGI